MIAAGFSHFQAGVCTVSLGVIAAYCLASALGFTRGK